jgi:hypothetical protein
MLWGEAKDTVDLASLFERTRTGLRGATRVMEVRVDLPGFTTKAAWLARSWALRMLTVGTGWAVRWMVRGTAPLA